MLWCALFRNKTIVCLQLCIISLRAPRASLSALINPASTHNAPTADCNACLLTSSIYLGKTAPGTDTIPGTDNLVRDWNHTMTSCFVTWAGACWDGGSSEGWGVRGTCWSLRARRTEGKCTAGVVSECWWFADVENSALSCMNWERWSNLSASVLRHVAGTKWSSYPGDLWHLTRSVSATEWTVSSKCAVNCY